MGGATQLARFAAGLEVQDPPRLTRVVFWRPVSGLSVSHLPEQAVAGRVTVVRQHGAGARRADVPCWRLPVQDAVPHLARARVGRVGHPTSVYWGAVALFGLKLVGEGRLLPALSGRGADTWRLAPLTQADQDVIAELVAAMPAEARALIDDPRPPYLLPGRTALVRAFLDALADTWPRTPGAPLLSDHPAYAAKEIVSVPELGDWARAIAAGRGSVRVSLQVELEDDEDAELDDAVRVAVVVRRGEDDRPVPVARVWRDAAAYPYPGQQRIKDEVEQALRRGASLWPPLARVLDATGAPRDLLAGADEVADLLGDGVVRLAAAGIDVLWPAGIIRKLTARLAITAKRPPSSTPSLLSMDALLQLRWRTLLDGTELTDAEVDRLAAARRPVVRLRGAWVVVDEKVVDRIRRHQARPLAATEALRLALTGHADLDGTQHPVDTPAWLEEIRTQIAAAPAPAAAPPGLQATLRHYQQAGLGWLMRLTALGLGGCLADDMGLGKTITLISLLLARLEDPTLPSGPNLVICPASMLGTWQREITRFAPTLDVRRHHGPARSLAELGPATTVLSTYDTARRDRAQLTAIDWSLVTADEAQAVKNAYSKTAAALRALPAHARVALTGTPVENNLSELWAILDFALPGLLGPLAAFRARYARPLEQGPDPETAQALGQLIGPFLLRRLKSDPGIAPELPAKTVTEHVVALSREQAGLYAAVAADTLEKITGAEGIRRRGLVLQLLTALKQICNHPAQYLKDTSPRRTAARSGKLALLDELLDVILAEHGAVLVFTQYVAMARLIAAHLDHRGIRTHLLHGATPLPERERMVEAFQRGEVPVFLLSLKAAGTGLTLTRANHVIHYDRWWNPAVEDQATDRAYRIGQTQPVQVHRLITEGTIEDRVAELLATKRALAHTVLASGEAALTELSTTELTDLVTLRAPR